jgi:hypothetical protein
MEAPALEKTNSSRMFAFKPDKEYKLDNEETILAEITKLETIGEGPVNQVLNKLTTIPNFISKIEIDETGTGEVTIKSKICKIESTNELFLLNKATIMSKLIAILVSVAQVTISVVMIDDAVGDYYESTDYVKNQPLMYCVIIPLIATYLGLKLSEQMTDKTRKAIAGPAEQIVGAGNVIFKLIVCLIIFFISLLNVLILPITIPLSFFGYDWAISSMVIGNDYLISISIIMCVAYVTMTQKSTLDILVNFGGVLIILDIDEFYASFIKSQYTCFTVTIDKSNENFKRISNVKVIMSFIKKMAFAFFTFLAWVTMLSLYAINIAVLADDE